MLNIKKYAIWFITGSQHLYGSETLEQVNRHSQQITESFNHDSTMAFQVTFKPVLTGPEEIRKLMLAANSDDDCAGIITWMHTFSPSKMWISGLNELRKPLLHFNTQFNRDIPWNTIDMDFMNANQSAHGDREHGFIHSRMGTARKVIVGHWEDREVRSRISAWMRTAAAFTAGRQLKVARFGDNMRQVAVTEGDKIEAQIKFGWSINGYGVGDLADQVNAVTDTEIEQLFAEYKKHDLISEDGLAAGPVQQSIKEQAKIEIGLRSFLESGGFEAFTTTFEDLHGLNQLPGLAVQRLMEQGYGFGGEGDWKTSALLRIMKILANGKQTSFMEDYTYHLEPNNEMILGSHMLEICPTIAANRPKIEVHPLGIGGKADPARMVFDCPAGPAILASLVDMGGRFRLIINVVQAVTVDKNMPKLPVARVLWKPEPSLSKASEAWIYSGGSHHSVLSYAVTVEQMADWAEMADIECIIIDKNTEIIDLRNQLRWNELIWKLR